MNRIHTALLASAGVLALATGASAAVTNWTGANGSWFTAANWSGATVPAATDVVTVGNGNTSAIDGARATAALTSLTISGGSTVDLQSRGTLTAATIMVGNGTTAGTLLESGSNNVTGTIALNGGTLANQVNGGSQTNAITLTGAANTISTTGGVFFVSSAISGTGGLVVAGAGQVTVSSNETYTGDTTVNSGAALSLGQGTAAGSVVGNITDNGTVALNHNAAFTFSGVISGTGAVTSVGANTLTAADTYSGLTQISTSTLFLSGAGSIANSSVISFSGAHSASLDISGITAATTSVQGLSSCNACTGTDTGQIAGGTVNLGAKNLTITGSPTLAYLGAITGTGSLTVSGTQTLAGANTYTGGTTINTGGLLTIGLGTGTTGSIVGNVLDNGNLTFHRSDAVTFAGVISGTGVVSVFGAGTVTLTGVNTVTGRITTNPGTLALSGNGSIASAALRNFGVFDISQTNAGATVQSLELTPTGTNPFNGALFLGSKTLTIANAFNEYDGVIKDGGIAGGTGGGVTLLAGTETFAGANTYTGATTITGGTLVLSTAGSIANSAVTVQNGATLSGTGTSGATTVQSGGILTPGGAATVGTLNVSGNLTLNAGAVVNADISASAADQIAVTGAASIAGVLNGTFAASGTYTSTQYTLISSTGTLSGVFNSVNITNLPVNYASALSYDAHDVFLNLAVVSSTGTAIVNSGTTTISGDRTTGGLSSTGSGGTVAITSGSTLTDNQNSNTTFSGTISGGGAVTKTGTGTLVLDGNNTYTGGTAINGGTLEIGDTAHPGAVIQGPVTVGSGGTLQGHGTINGAVTIGSGGNLQPGGTIGTVTVGSASFANGSTFTVETSATQADLLKATGAVSIGTGTKLALTEDAPLSSFGRVTTYTIVQAGTGVTGTFGTVTSSSASFLPTVTYGANTVSVTLLRTDLAAALAVNANQANAAAAVLAGGASALSTPLAAMSDAGVQAAYGQLAGDIHASLRSAAVEDSRIIRDAVLDHMNAPIEGGTDVWAVGFGGYGSIAANGNASGLHHDSAGFIAGADMNAGSGFRLGLGGAYSANNASTTGHASTATGNSGHVLGYAGWSDGMVDLKLGGDYGWGTVNVARTLAAYAQTDANRQDQQTGQVFGEFGYRIGGTPIEPYIDLASISATTGAFTETGGSAALSGGQKTDTQTYSTLGLRVSLPMEWAMPHFDVGWQHAFNSFVPGETQTLQAVSQSFTVLGAPLARDAATVRAGIGMAVSPDATLSIDYDGSVGGRVQNNAVRGGLDWRF